MHPNVLAERYASPEMQELWSRRNVILLGREFWIATLEQQGADKLAISEYKRFKNDINLDRIAEREKRLRHDVAAEIEEFNEISGFKILHTKMTSRDKTENVEQILIMRSLILLRDRAVAILRRLDDKAQEFKALDICGRSHNTPAQVTTLGKRFANIAQELFLHFGSLSRFISTYQFRGIKGPMGTQADQVLNEYNLFMMGPHCGPSQSMISVGQVYPRSIDFATISLLVALAMPMANFAKMVRLMSGHDFLHEGFGDEQIGSSAMPHKINARTCERICGLLGVLKGHLAMITHVGGDQWYEGDVSCSVVRRVIFPDAFFALDGLFEAVMTVLDEMVIFPKMMEAELNRYRPFMATTALLRAAIDKGMSRQDAHERLRRHAVMAVHKMRAGKPNTLVSDLAKDSAFPLDRSEIDAITAQTDHGQAEHQIDALSLKISRIIVAYPAASRYSPSPIR